MAQRGEGGELTMIEKRRNQRVACSTKCVLYLNGTKARGIVGNISLSGAQVTSRRNLSGLIHRGDACSLLICHLASMTYSRYAGKIAWFGTTGIGLQFCIGEKAPAVQPPAGVPPGG